MGAVKTTLRSTADLLLGNARIQRVALRSAARRGRTIVLLWHRIHTDGPAAHEVVRTVPVGRFGAQLDLLQELGSVVSLAACDAPRIEDGEDGKERPRFVLTFDDDDARHREHVLPVLAERGLPATFFLSGRWLHGHGPYWWEVLEEQIAALGTAAVARRHGLPEGLSAPRLGQELTGTPQARALAAQAREEGPPPMSGEDAAALVAAGMEIGFHTIEHEVLPNLRDAALPGAVTDGRAELADALGVPVKRFAYPHGLVDERVAEAVADAGYHSAWTTRKRAARPGDAPFARGRWEVSHRPLDEIQSTLLRGFARPIP